MTYVDEIEPRLTPLRTDTPVGAAQALVHWCQDLEQELTARLGLVSPDELSWQPHPDSNSAAVTVWHVARWFDVLGSRAFTGRPARDDLWHTKGWLELTGYEPDGIGFAGLGTLTGYTPEEMRAVPVMDAPSLSLYFAQSSARLIEHITELDDELLRAPGASGLSPYTAISGTVQGSFGHIGEIDALIALHSRLGHAPLDSATRRIQ